MIDYGHGDDCFKYNINFKANFSSNVWYKGTSKLLITHLKETLNSIENYPAPSAEHFSKQLEIHHKLPKNSSIITNGATEAFYLIAHTFHSKTATICTPSFSEYEQAAKMHNLAVDFIPRKEITTHIFTTDIAFICNPNNPDGYENTSSEILQIANNNPNTYFVIDEAYTEFTPSNISCISLLKQAPNIIIVKSLTKLFCIPGLRLGYLLANPTVIKKIIAFKMPWNVNIIAIKAGEFIFNNYHKIYPNFSTCFKHTTALKKAINTINGFEVIPSKTNYFLIKLKEEKATELKEYLAQKHQLLIRSAANFRTLNEHYIRIASQTPTQNKLLINALLEWKNCY